MTLPCYLSFLDKVHQRFYALTTEGKPANVKQVIKECRAHLFDKDLVALFDLLFQNSKGYDFEKAQKSYEIIKCRQHGLSYSEIMEGEPDKRYIYIVQDYADEPLKRKMRDLTEGFAGLNIICISVYWLYLSCYLMAQLPLDPFRKFKQQYLMEERRIGDLILESLEITHPTLAQSYQERQKQEKQRAAQ